jgi:hypothetical protein
VPTPDRDASATGSAGQVAVNGKLLFEEDQVARVRWKAMTRKIYFADTATLEH